MINLARKRKYNCVQEVTIEEEKACKYKGYEGFGAVKKESGDLVKARLIKKRRDKNQKLNKKYTANIKEEKTIGNKNL